MNTYRMELQHPGPSKAHSFWATLDKKGRRIDISFEDGESVSIQIEGKTPASGFCPTEDGKVIYCLLEDGGERLFETSSGRRLFPAKKGQKKVVRTVLYQ